MRQNDNKNLSDANLSTEIETTAEARPVRTFVDDIARLKRENKLTQKDISQIDTSIMDKIRQIEEARNEKVNSEQFYQKSAKQEDKQFASGVSSSLLSPKNETETALSRLEIITQNIEKKYFSEEAESLEPNLAARQEINKPEITEARKTEIKPEKKKEATPEEKNEEEKALIQEALSAIQKEEVSLKTRRTEIKEKKERIEQENKSRKELEAKTEREEEELRKQKNEAETAKERQEWEKKRQNKEDERQQIERERWDADQNIANLEKRIEEIKKQESILTQKKERNEIEIQKLEKKRLVIRAEKEKPEIVKKLADAKKRRAELETEWKDISGKMAEIGNKKITIEKRKNIIETEIQTLETREYKSADPTETHKIEEERWKKDGDFRGLEEENLTAEKEEAFLKESLIKLEAKSRETLHTEQETLDKMAEIDKIISASK